jgi:hypothetical protein
MEYYCDFTDNELKFLKDKFGNIEGGTIIKSSFYTYREPIDEDDVAYEYNGQRYGWIIPQESRDCIENVMIFDLNQKKIMEGVKNPLNSGNYDISLDVLSCNTDKSRLYFTFKLLKENCYISAFNRRDKETTPKKKFKKL